MSNLHRVRFRRSDGQTLFLGEPGTGGTDDPRLAWAGEKRVAAELAAARNFIYGPCGYEYWVEPVTETVKGDQS